jgi:hypothetical protein
MANVETIVSDKANEIFIHYLPFTGFMIPFMRQITAVTQASFSNINAKAKVFAKNAWT